MTVPLIRQYNSALAVVGVPVNATDAITGETQLQLSNDNVIEDFVNSPDTANAGDLIQTELFINQLQAGPAFFSVSSSPLTRSSYHADDDFQDLRAARIKTTQIG